MAKRLLPLVFLFLIFPFLSSAQQPYWQQEVNYTIRVQLDDERHELQAEEEIEYINHSPHELTFIYFHLWPNAYRNNQTAFAKQQLTNNSLKFQFAEENARGFIDGLDFKVDGQPARLEVDPEHIDIGKLVLNRPLPSGGRVRITTPFRVKIPHMFSRLGHVGQSYQITQWYPKPAVYDHKGWHPMPYLDQGEFYSEFGSFDVSITLPANYTVGATGVLQNPEERARLDSVARATAERGEVDPDLGTPTSAPSTKTLRYLQDRVHDFAWFADKNFYVLKSEVELPHSKRSVTTWLMFLGENADKWFQSVKDINQAIYYYSLFVGDYPYEQATAVDGALAAGSGMEYPMVTVTIPEALVHEIGHNWFYGVLASQERRHPWMDEGINSYVENRIARLEDPMAGDLSSMLSSPILTKIFHLENLNANGLNQLPYQMSATRGLDQPAELPAAYYRYTNYGTIVYGHVAQLFDYLEQYLGRERFDACMHAYYARWQFRHPYPEDLQAVFEEVSGENLQWFFKDLFETVNRLDVKPTRTTQVPGGTQVTVRNRGNTAVAIPVGAYDREGELVETRWTKPTRSSETLTFTSPGIYKFIADPEFLLPEVNQGNNQIRTEGLLRRARPLRLQVLAGIEQPSVRQVYFYPVLGWNTLDRFMPGIALYTSSFIQKRLSLLAVPMYSFRQNQLNGIYDATYAIYRGQAGQLKLGANAWRFERFSRLTPTITFTPRPMRSVSPRQQLRLQYTRVWEENFTREFVPTPLSDYGLYSLTYSIEKKNALRTLGLEVDVNRFASATDPAAGGFGSTQLARGVLRFSQHYAPKKQIKARVFGGSFFGTEATGSAPFYLGLSTSFDYLKEEIFLDRSQISNSMAAFVRQTDDRDGGFRGFVPVVSADWMTALNLIADLPITPFAVFMDLGRVGGTDQTYYGAGLSLSLFKEVFKLYLPVAGSQYAEGLPESFGEFRGNVRFSLHLQKLNPFRLLEQNL